MKYPKHLLEELTSYQKKVVDIYNSLPKNKTVDSSEAMKGEHTIFLPLIHKDDYGQTIPNEVMDHLGKNGFHIPSFHDYKAGYANDRHGRIVSIGKALNKTKAPDEIKAKFENDPNRQVKNVENLRVAITKDPYHVAGMSTDRGWTSCMHMDEGCNANYLAHDIRHGTHVAYLVHKDDTEIKNPISRIALKPFSNGNHFILRPEHTTYGAENNHFEHTVNRWAETHFPVQHNKEDEPYELVGDLYDDSTNLRLSPKAKEARLRSLKNNAKQIGKFTLSDEKNIRMIDGDQRKDLLHHIAKLDSETNINKHQLAYSVISASRNKQNAFDHYYNHLSSDEEKIEAIGCGSKRSALNYGVGIGKEEALRLLPKINPKEASNFINAINKNHIKEDKDFSEKISNFYEESTGKKSISNLELKNHMHPEMFKKHLEDESMTIHDLPIHATTKENLDIGIKNYRYKKSNLNPLDYSPHFSEEHARQLYENSKDPAWLIHANMKHSELNPDLLKELPQHHIDLMNRIRDPKVLKEIANHVMSSETENLGKTFYQLSNQSLYVNDPDLTKFAVDHMFKKNINFFNYNPDLGHAAIKHPDIPDQKKVEIFRSMDDIPHAQYMKIAEDMPEQYREKAIEEVKKKIKDDLL